MGLTLATPPVAEPVSLEEAKAQCRVRHESDDAYIQGLIRSATRYVEKILGKSLMARTYLLTLDAFTDAIELPRGPVQSVTSVQYADGAGETQTVAASEYTVDLMSSRQWIVRNSDATWPATMDGINAVSIQYVAGFDTLPAEYEDLKHAIMLLIGAWYYQREAVSEKPMQEVPLAVDALIQPYRAILV